MTAPARFPFLEHGGVLAFAHRGGALEGRENSMAAFTDAVSLGYRYLETDTYATRDGRLIAFHDDELDRVTDARGKVGDLTWAELQRARIGGTEPIPLLEDLLGAWPDVRINIDPKHGAAIEPLIALIKRMGVRDRVCIGSFSDRRIARMRDAFDGRLCTSMGPKGVLRLKVAARGVPSWAFRAGCAQVPTKAYGITVVTRSFVDEAVRRGLQVHVWIIDDAAEMHRLLDLGVHGIMTDRPRVLKDVLVSRGAWVGR
jgi:glycerophosphoryl diester phosphodiesterase